MSAAAAPAARPRLNGVLLADRLRADLARGRYAPGQRLVEAELTRDTGASRAHVREALRQLSAEGLIDIEAFRGAVVKRMTREDVHAVGRVRESLEGLAARLLAERRPAGDEREALRDLRARLVAAAEAPDYDRYAVANDALHAFIIARCGNAYVERTLAGLRLHVKRTLSAVPVDYPVMIEGNVEHLALIDAILLGNGEIAEAVMRLHVRKGSEMIDRALAAAD